MAQNTPRIEYANLNPPFGFIGFTMDFDRLYRHYFDQLVYITMRLIVFENIPETIDETFLKYLLIVNGKAVFFRLDQDITDNRQYAVIPLHSGDLVALNGTNSDMQTMYYMQRNVLVTNPVFNKTYNLTPGQDCEIVYCTEPDKYRIFGYGGLFALIARTATILADNDISINCAQKNTRLVNLIGADDQQSAKSAQAAIDAMYAGKPYTIAQKNLVADLQGIPMTQKTPASEITQLIEMRQYIYSHFYEILGLQTHDNMKKERLITDEINDNEEISALNVEDIYISIKSGIDRVNKMFGTDIRVSINPIIQRAHEDDDADGDPDLTRLKSIIEKLESMTGDEEPDDDQTEDAAEEDQTEDAAEEDQTEDAADDQSDDAAEEDQTEDAADDQSDDAAEEDQTEDAADDQSDDAAEDQSDDAAEEDQTEDAAEDQSDDAAEGDQTEDAAELPEDLQMDITVNASDDADVNIKIETGVITDDVPGEDADMDGNGTGTS